MNFFRAQDAARRKTLQLTALFSAAVLTLILLTNLLVAVVVVIATDAGQVANADIGTLASNIPAKTWALITAGVIGVIAIACTYKYLLVRGGGRSIAESLGGIRVLQSSEDRAQRRLLNIVEEMSLAAGIAVPPVYLIPEPGINAFAAGFSPDDAVIGINQGTIDNLNRDELQGVVAHEFSHILNGDTRINLRLIALLHGILFIGMIGYALMRGAGHSRSSSRDSNGALPILLLGVGLLVIGYGGTFFGNMIKAAVSRQREYLADAAAVQFTRNPSGIADALKKIGGLPAGSAMESTRAGEASHMFFGQAVTTFFNSMMSTHPPLADRIKAIEPSWSGEFPTPQHISVDGGDTIVSGFDSGADYDLVKVGMDEDRLAEEVGELNHRGFENSQTVVDSTPIHIQKACKDPWAARGLIYAMLMNQESDTRKGQFKYVDDNENRGIPKLVAQLTADMDKLDDLHKLTLLELAMPALKELSTPQYNSFIKHTVAITKLDNEIDLFEWVLHQLLIKDLRPHYEKPDTKSKRISKIETCQTEISFLLSVLAYHGDKSLSHRETSFKLGMDELGLTGELQAVPDDNYQMLTKALLKLRNLRPLIKPKLIKACAATALADNHITVAEGALLQGVSATLDCPLPPSIYSER